MLSVGLNPTLIGLEIHFSKIRLWHWALNARKYVRCVRIVVRVKCLEKSFTQLLVLQFNLYWSCFLFVKSWITTLYLYLCCYNNLWGRRMIGISGSLIRSKTLMELLFNPCVEFRWSPEGPVSQIHSPHIHIDAPGIFSDLLRSVQVLKRDWGAESNGKLPHLFILSKTAASVPEFVVEDLASAALQSRFLRLQWRTCPWAEHTDDDYDDE